MSNKVDAILMGIALAGKIWLDSGAGHMVEYDFAGLTSEEREELINRLKGSKSDHWPKFNFGLDKEKK